MTGRQATFLGALLGGLAVGAGAFGAHALRGRLSPEDLQVFETAARYQMYHALALLGVGLWLERGVRPLLEWSARLFVLGVLLFSGSLYGLALSGQRWLGLVTPLGGLAFIFGWLALLLAAARRRADG